MEERGERWREEEMEERDGGKRGEMEGRRDGGKRWREEEMGRLKQFRILYKGNCQHSQASPKLRVKYD